MRLLWFVLFLFSIQASAQDLCPSVNHIFLVHGIGGNAKSFGQMEKYLEAEDPCYSVHSFEYDTGNSSLNTYDFAQSFDKFLMAKIGQNTIKASDRISLIMHSQGGLVGNLWLSSARVNRPLIYQQVDAFITLSTPHWGAEIANIGRHLFFTLPQGMRNPISPFGRMELNEMSYGSQTIENLNSIFIENFRPLHFRPLAVGGIHKIKNKVIGEHDVVVPVFSSRPDHISAFEEVNINEHSGVIAASAFTKSNRIPFVTVAATHLKLDLPGVATIPEKCLGSSGCDHPSLPVIINHLKGRTIASVNEKLDHFRTSINLKNSTGSKIDKKDVKIEILDDQMVSIPLSQKVNKYRGDAKRDEGLAFSFHGHTKRSGTQKIKILLSVKNKFKREIEIPVEGGFSTILQLKLH